MSGIFGIINLNHAPVESGDLTFMANALQRRGPDGQSFWQNSNVGLGHTLLASTESALFERMPFRDLSSGCVITADARIDNREELISSFGINDEGKFVGDGELILRAYLKWGHACPEHLMGDFAFAIWDPCKRELFCARDHFGMRPFNFYHEPGKIFVFASAVPALLALQQVPKKINEARIADFLHNPLEGVDTVTTFYEDLYRLSPAHMLCVSERKLDVKRYWYLQATGPTFNFSSDDEYVATFLDVFTASVKSRLVSADSAHISATSGSVSTVGSMLSGGMDSGSVVAIASRIFAEQGLPPLETFSAVGPDPLGCIETQSIHKAIGIGKIDPNLINCAELSPYLDEIRVLTMQMDEPFDGHMSLIRLVYLVAHHKDVKVMLDGGGGDVVLTEGTQMARLIRSGHWSQALSDAFGLKRFYGQYYSVPEDLINAAKSAFIPNWARRLKRSLSFKNEVGSLNTIINPSFARRIDFSERLEKLKHHSPKPWLPYAEERAKLISHPYLVVGRERYDRIASAYSIEPRDPFLDRRLVDFCLRLPSRKLQAGGWPKILLRQAMAGRLPDHVRWRLGNQHLGPEFTTKVFLDWTGSPELNNDDIERLSPYLTSEIIAKIRIGGLQGPIRTDILSLAFWLRRAM